MINYNLHDLTEDGYISIKTFDQNSYDTMIYLIQDIVDKTIISNTKLSEKILTESIHKLKKLNGSYFVAKNADEYEREIINKII